MVMRQNLFFFVQATPGEVLRKSVQREAKLSEVKVKVVEKGGTDIKSLLQHSDVQPMKSCIGQCSVENVRYRVHSNLVLIMQLW